MSEKNPLAGFTKPVAKVGDPDPTKLDTIQVPRDADIQKIAEAAQKLPQTAATAMYDPKTGEFKQLTGEPLSPEMLAEAKKTAQLQAAKSMGVPSDILKLIADELEAGKPADEIIDTLTNRLGVTPAEVAKAEKVSKGKELRDHLAIIDECHKLTEMHSKAKEFVQNAKDRFGYADGEIRMKYYLEGAATALCWVLGISPEPTTAMFHDKIGYHPEWTCADPECKGCGVIRSSFKPEDNRDMPRVGAIKGPEAIQ